MKKTLSSKALMRETAYWERMKKALKENPGKACRK